MNAIRKTMAVVSVLIFCLLGSTAYANEMGKSYELRDLLWTRVENLQGRYIGIVSNFVVDSEGHVSLAIIDRSSTKANEPEELVAVPFDALKWKSKGDYFVLNISRLVLAQALPSIRLRMYRILPLLQRCIDSSVFNLTGLKRHQALTSGEERPRVSKQLQPATAKRRKTAEG